MPPILILFSHLASHHRLSQSVPFLHAPFPLSVSISCASRDRCASLLSQECQPLHDRRIAASRSPHFANQLPEPGQPELLQGKSDAAHCSCPPSRLRALRGCPTLACQCLSATSTLNHRPLLHILAHRPSPRPHRTFDIMTRTMLPAFWKMDRPPVETQNSPFNIPSQQKNLHPKRARHS